MSETSCQSERSVSFMYLLLRSDFRKRPLCHLPIMSITRPFEATDVLKFNQVNADPWTATVSDISSKGGRNAESARAVR